MPDVTRFNWKDGFYNPKQIEEYKASNERAAAERMAQKNRMPSSAPRGGVMKAGKKNFSDSHAKYKKNRKR